MADKPGDRDPKALVEAARKAFEQEFERFASFAESSPTLTGLGLETAQVEQRALADLRTRHLGKKSALAAGKKMIGRVTPEERALFAQRVQQNEAEIINKIERVEQALTG